MDKNWTIRKLFLSVYRFDKIVIENVDIRNKKLGLKHTEITIVWYTFTYYLLGRIFTKTFLHIHYTGFTMTTSQHTTEVKHMWNEAV